MEILFRGKNKQTGVWEYGDLWHALNPEDMDKPFTIIEGHRVIPETVGQYTGRHDKRNRRIFKGDVLGGLLEGGVVVWIGKDCRFGIEIDGELNEITFVELEQKDLEVIGNIHDKEEA